jgi:hypothetical protein
VSSERLAAHFAVTGKELRDAFARSSARAVWRLEWCTIPMKTTNSYTVEITL